MAKASRIAFGPPYSLSHGLQLRHAMGLNCALFHGNSNYKTNSYSCL